MLFCFFCSASSKKMFPPPPPPPQKKKDKKVKKKKGKSKHNRDVSLISRRISLCGRVIKHFFFFFFLFLFLYFFCVSRLLDAHWSTVFPRRIRRLCDSARLPFFLFIIKKKQTNAFFFEKTILSNFQDFFIEFSRFFYWECTVEYLLGFYLVLPVMTWL